MLSRISIPEVLLAFNFLLGHASAQLGQLLEENQKRVQRLTALHYDLNQTNIDLWYDAELDVDRSPYEQQVMNALAHRLNYENMDSYVADVKDHMNQGDNVVIQGFFNESLGDAERMRKQNAIVFGVGGPIGLMTGLVATKFNINPLWPKFKYVDKVYHAKVNGLVFDEIKALGLDLKNGVITKSVYTERVKSLRQAGKKIGGLGYKAAVKLGLVQADMATDVLRVTRNLKIGFRALASLDFAFFFIGFIPLIMEKIQGEEAKTELRAAIRDAVPLRFAMEKYRQQSVVWSTYKGKIISSIDTWEALQAGADTGSQCYFGMDLTLSQKQDGFLEDFLRDMNAITDQSVWDSLKDTDTERGLWTNDDPSLESIQQILAEMDAAEGVTDDDDEDVEYDGDIFDSPNLGNQSLPTQLINGSNVRYMELADNKGAIWKNTGPFWTYQEGLKDDRKGPRHKLQSKSRLANTMEFELVDTDTDVANAGKKLSININSGTHAASVKWEGESSSIAVDTTSWSNLIATNGWTAYYSLVVFDEAIKALNAQECSRTKGWTIEYDISGYRNQGLRETYRSKDMIKSTTMGGPPFAPVETFPRFELDLANNKLSIWYSDGSDPTVLDVNGDSYLPRLVVT